MDSDDLKDKQTKKIIDLLKKIGPHSKQLLNYSYPPLLYQRGDDASDDDEESQEHEGDECDEDSANSHMLGESGEQLPQLNDSDDAELMALENQLPSGNVSGDEEILRRLRSVDDDINNL